MRGSSVEDRCETGVLMSNLLAEPDTKAAESSSSGATPRKIGLYGNFGAGNLGNDCTLMAVIEQAKRRISHGELRCFCTDPERVKEHYKVASFPAEPSILPRGRSWLLAKAIRVAFNRIPTEVVHWFRTLLIISDLDMLIIAGTGVVQDAVSGPFGAPFVIFKFALLAALCRVKLVFLNVGVGPINHPLSKWFVRRSLALAKFRTYRDEASRKYLAKIGFYSEQDRVYPDVVFGLMSAQPPSRGQATRKPIIGVGLSDCSSLRNSDSLLRAYLEAMATFVDALQRKGYAVRLLIGDTKYDTVVVAKFIELLKVRKLPLAPASLLVDPAPDVETLIEQIVETEAVVSARYHNLVLAMLHGKPLIAISHHPKFDSLATEAGLGRYLIPLTELNGELLTSKFGELESELDEVAKYIRMKAKKYRAAVELEFDELVLLARADSPSCART